MRGQTYAKIVEVLVVDGGSDDGTQALAAAAGATVLDNPHRVQAAGLNVGIAAAAGEVIVRVDGHCTIEPDYVERCVDALARTGAAMVGGAMSPVAERGMPAAIALAMASPLGAGPARFHSGGAPGWVDTVYLGAYRTADAVAVGGYATDVGVNEDAEFAVRIGATRRGVVRAVDPQHVQTASDAAGGRQTVLEVRHLPSCHRSPPPLVALPPSTCGSRARARVVLTLAPSGAGCLPRRRRR